MKGIIILAHGSREPDVERNFARIIEEFKIRSGIPYVTAAYLISTENGLEVGLQRLVNLGVLEVLILPFLLLDGFHIKQTIPEEINRLAGIHPNIKIKLGKSLCSDLQIVDLLIARANESLA